MKKQIKKLIELTLCLSVLSTSIISVSADTIEDIQISRGDVSTKVELSTTNYVDLEPYEEYFGDSPLLSIMPLYNKSTGTNSYLAPVQTITGIGVDLNLNNYYVNPVQDFSMASGVTGTQLSNVQILLIDQPDYIAIHPSTTYGMCLMYKVPTISDYTIPICYIEPSQVGQSSSVCTCAGMRTFSISNLAKSTSYDLYDTLYNKKIATITSDSAGIATYTGLVRTYALNKGDINYSVRLQNSDKTIVNVSASNPSVTVDNSSLPRTVYVPSNLNSSLPCYIYKYNSDTPNDFPSNNLVMSLSSGVTGATKIQLPIGNYGDRFAILIPTDSNATSFNVYPFGLKYLIDGDTSSSLVSQFYSVLNSTYTPPIIKGSYQITANGCEPNAVIMATSSSGKVNLLGTTNASGNTILTGELPVGNYTITIAGVDNYKGTMIISSTATSASELLLKNIKNSATTTEPVDTSCELTLTMNNLFVGDKVILAKDTDISYDYNVATDKVISTYLAPSNKTSANLSTTIEQGQYYVIAVQSSTGEIRTLDFFKSSTVATSANKTVTVNSSSTAYKTVALTITNTLANKVVYLVDSTNESNKYALGKSSTGTTIVSSSSVLAGKYYVKIGDKSYKSNVITVASNKTSVSASMDYLAFTSDSSSTSVKGDINGNGKVDISDLLVVSKSIIGSTTLTSNQKLIADINGDSIINTVDLVRIAKIIVGI